MEDIISVDCCELETALRSGDAELAAKITKKLAEQKSKISVEINKHSLNSPEKFISINVCIEDRFSSGTCVPLKIIPSTTFQALSRMMYERFEFPLQVQQWIVQKQKKITNLSKSLSLLGVGDGDTVHLYLLPASSVNVTKELARETYLMAFHSVKYMTQPSFEQTRGASHQTQSDFCESLSSLYDNSSSENNSVPENIAEELHGTTVGWCCPVCTYVNQPTRPGCGVCSAPRPDSYQMPPNYVPLHDEQTRIDKEVDMLTRQSNLDRLLSADQKSLLSNTSSFVCPICFNEVSPGEGVLLRDCLHTFCKECLCGLIEASTSATVICPFTDATYSCDKLLQEREIKALVSEEVYSRYLTLSVQEAEARETNSFHCRTVDCQGWCVYEDDVNTFQCPVCNICNCLTCKAQHVTKTCQQYQDDLKERANTDQAAKKTRKKMEKMLRKGDAMYCPTCQIVLMKKDGCDWLRCSMCKTEICWVTRGPRWGSQGEGDESGGCRCRVGGRLCHRKCRNCH